MIMLVFHVYVTGGESQMDFYHVRVFQIIQIDLKMISGKCYLKKLCSHTI
jgi:hypothetical protein